MAKNKWDSIEWIGSLNFPADYDYQGFKVKGVGPFKEDLEEMMYHFAAKLETDYVSNPIFIKNFYDSVYPSLPEDIKGLKFPNDFMPYLKEVKSFIDRKKEQKKVLTKDEKKAAQAEKLALKEQNGFVILNGTKQPIGSFTIEPPGILITRGEDKRLGSWKFRIRPEDVAINASKGKGPTPPDGHKWKEVIENKGALWVAHYFVKVHGFKDLPKKILFSQCSDVSKENEQEKYEKARKIILNWEAIQSHIFKSFNSDDEKTRMIAMIVYLVQLTGCRIGNEKDTDIYADTVGISTIRKEHIILKGNKLTLEFLGKDSVEYKNSVDIDPRASKVIKAILDCRKDDEEVFKDIKGFEATTFLREVVPGTSVKVFRTAYGTKLLCEELQKMDFSDPTLTESKKLHMYDLCNLEVAKKLNHKKTPPKNFDEKTELLNKKLSEGEDAVVLLEKKLADDLRKVLKDIKIAKETFEGEQLEKRLEKLNEKKERISERLAKAKNRLETKRTKLKFREDTKEISIGTSRTSYSSPRIAYSWCKDTGVPIEKIYSKSAIGKMDWAKDTPVSYWKKFPNVKAN